MSGGSVSQTRVQFIESDDGRKAVVLVHTTVRGGLVAHLIDTFSRIKIEVHKVESRLDDEGWVQRLVVAAPRRQHLDGAWLDELRAAVFATIEMINSHASVDSDASSGTFAVVPSATPQVEETG
jgi:UTP:GlnB (protein PII) uridylyltransferase